jgi:hypothetical protein
MTTCRELSGAIDDVLRRRKMVSVLKLLTIMLLISSRQGHAIELIGLNKNQGIMLPNQQDQLVNVNNNITITCVFIHTAEIVWILPKLSTDEAVWKETV